MSRPSKRAPHMHDLIVLWMKTHYHAVPAVVFFDPLMHWGAISARFPERTSPINAFIIALRTRTIAQAIDVVNETPDSAPYTEAWDGRRFIHSNS